MEKSVAILADDLTGALDAAAAFASRSRPIDVVWAGRAPAPRLDFAIDSESRGISPDAAGSRVARFLPMLSGHAVPFKKVDSLLRGNTMAELAICGASAAFASVVLAPAFPAQNRLTHGGRQHALIGDRWQPIEDDLVGQLAVRKVAGRLVPRGRAPRGAGVMICDAECEEDLAVIASAAGELAQPTLWCGSAGLARAIAAPVGAATPSWRTALAIIGSEHPASTAQGARLAEAAPELVVTLRSAGAIAETVARLGETHARHRRAGLLFDMPRLMAEEADGVYRDTFHQLVGALPRPDVLVVTGGDTLLRLVESAAATHLEAIGEVMPGIPLSRFPDGQWSGAEIISKSGAFGDRGLLMRILGVDREHIS